MSDGLVLLMRNEVMVALGWLAAKMNLAVTTTEPVGGDGGSDGGLHTGTTSMHEAGQFDIRPMTPHAEQGPCDPQSAHDQPQCGSRQAGLSVHL